MRRVGNVEVDRSSAFRPEVLAKIGVRVWFKRTATKRFNWLKLRYAPATLVVEIWTDDRGDVADYEPGNCWYEHSDFET